MRKNSVITKRTVKGGLRKLPPRLPKEEKVKKFDDRKYVRVLITEPEARFREVGEAVGRKELKWVFYTTENLIGVHYYLKLNT